MQNYTYETVTGPVTIEIDEKWAALLAEADEEEANANRRHSRPDHKYAPGEPVSLDSLIYDGELLTDRNYDGSVETIEFSIDLERAFSVLTELQRLYMTEVYLNGYSYAELERKNGISEAAIRKHIKLALQKMKNYFA